MENLAREGRALGRAGRAADDIIGVGTAVMGSLSEQRATIKGARTRVLDMMHTLGMSNSLIRMIERRLWTDRMIMYAGMVVTLLVFYYFYHYWKDPVPPAEP
jgi:Golgi SNAP receptor complex protein 2